METIVISGSFDGSHRGHEEIIKETSPKYNKVIVAIGNNPEKKSLFTLEQRVKHMQAITKNLHNVFVTSFEGLLVDFCIQNNVKTIIK